jgi:hypothetical protein
VYDLTKLKIHNTHILATLDIKDLHVNIPTDGTIHIAKNILLLNRVDIETINHIISLLQTTLSQNYFGFNK